MKVLLIGNYAPDDQKSMVAFSAMLERELPRLGCEVRVVSPQARAIRLPMPRKLLKWAGYVDKFLLFPLGLASHLRWADVVHITDHSNAMYAPRVTQRPNVLTCHDVIAIQAALGIVKDWQVGWTGRIFQSMIARGFGHADRVVCDSSATLRDVLSLKLADPARVVMVPIGLNNEFGPLPQSTVREALAPYKVAPEDEYLLHVGHEHPRKNRIAVLKAFIALQDKAAAKGEKPVVRTLVFVGSALTQEMIALIALHPGLAKQIHVLRDVSHESLRALYCGATALLFPSIQEGFGWPIIEGQACGCPVFTSNLAPMNDIGSDAAVYVDPNDASAIADAIMEAAPRLSQMRTKGIANAAHYSAAQMAQTYVGEYRKVMAARVGALQTSVKAASR
ncbi:glycosyltransferase family 1 protein [Variovorax sp. J22R133]|uniref:glycosyltransferase family 4 protein n=1 Tax=Variovorax brevis TaxID=3053503 RepID=UPI002575D186|nr:glycosyltransferase family 1 protein [Variovorax sp. J22R133]MDM0115910.1 glycosyltransferase family 1 protein [Variovorax sp. J22R133]